MKEETKVELDGTTLELKKVRERGLGI